MSFEIHPLRPEEIAELSRFLTAGFGAPADADFAAPDVLSWKYFDPLGDTSTPRAFIAKEAGRIVACMGLCPTRLVVGGSRSPVSAIHGIDWLADKTAVSAGLMVRERLLECAEVYFVIGGTPQAIAISKRSGYRFPIAVSEFCKILRPASWLRRSREDGPLWKAVLKTGRDYGRRLIHRDRPPQVQLRLSPRNSFGPEIEQIAQACRMPEIHTRRTAALLNHYLRYPRKRLSGWWLLEGDRQKGFALLSLVPHGRIQMGRIADCFLEGLDPALWRAAIHVLTKQLMEQGADAVACYGTTPWMVQSLKGEGFYCSRLSPLTLRDPKNLIPRDAAFFLTHLEADHAYL